MEKILIFAVLTLAVILVAVIVLLINDYKTRKKKTNDSLSRAVDSALDSLKYNNIEYNQENAEIFSNDLIDNILLQMKERENINVRTANIDDDMISIYILMGFKWFFFNKVLSQERTVLLTRYAHEEVVDHYTATFMAGDDIYTEIDVPEEDILVRPDPPEVHGYEFIGWCIKEDPERLVLTEAEWETMYIAENTTFDAVYHSL